MRFVAAPDGLPPSGLSGAPFLDRLFEVRPVRIWLNDALTVWALVDDEDSDVLRWQWSAHHCQRGTLYARRLVRRKPVYLHRVVLERIGPPPTPAHVYCDHINGDGLDNRRRNLRWVTASENARNPHPPSYGIQVGAWERLLEAAAE